MGEKSASRLEVTHPSGKYDVVIGQGLLPRLIELAGIKGPTAIVSDSNVAPLYAGRLGPVDALVVMPAGERHKTLATVQTIYDQLLAKGIDRSGTVVALGGGVVGDVAGFVAATFLRGVDFVQSPTSLLAMVDASVGGKTGVDMPQGKNLVGAFKQPAAVIADLDTLVTLPAEELAAGMAEVVKHGLISAPELFRELEEGSWAPASSSPGQLQSLVTRAIQVKRDVVQEDPFEQGRRAVLNLGHTFAHAVEQVSQYGVRHGEAVGMGLVAAANLSHRLGFCPAGLQPRIERVLAAVNLPTRIPAGLRTDALMAAMGSDKKKAAGKIRFILIKEVGDVFISADVASQEVLAAIEAVKAAR